MADTTISGMAALAGADVADGDLLPIVDISAAAGAKNKSLTPVEARIAFVTQAAVLAALGVSDLPVKSATVTLTAADLATLDTVPFELVAAPGAGKVLVPANGGGAVMLFQLNGGTAPQQTVGLMGAYFNGSPPTFLFGELFDISQLLFPIIPDSVMFRQPTVYTRGAALTVAENGSVVFFADDTLLVPGAIATSAIGAAGTGYIALETVTVGNATIRIDTVGGSGEVLTYTVTVAGTNNIVDAAQETTGGSGADFTVDINTVDVSVNPMTLTVKTIYSVMDVA